MDQPHLQRARDVSAGEHTDHTVDRGGRAHVDRHHVGPGVNGEVERAVEHAVDAEVVDVVLLPHRQVEALVAGAARADATEGDGLRRLALGEQLHRVEDLHVPGASAEVSAEVAGRGVAVETRALLLQQRRGADEDAGRAEPALQGTGRRECGGHAVTLACVDPFERGDLAPSTRSSERLQLTIALPSTSTVQQPH